MKYWMNQTLLFHTQTSDTNKNTPLLSLLVDVTVQPGEPVQVTARYIVLGLLPILQ